MRPRVILLAAALAVVMGPVLLAAEPAKTTTTTINVEKMCCQGCARKVAAKLYEIRGVKKVRADVKKKIVVVEPQRGVVLSPRAVWEAIEKANERPLRLVGPSGKFTKKPRR